MLSNNYNPAVNDSRKEQERTKPEIDDLIPFYLDGEPRKNAVEFVAYLRADGLKLRWNGRNSWKTNYKGNPICQIFICFPNDYRDRPREYWFIIPHFKHLNEYENIIITENWQSYFWKDIFTCPHNPEYGQPDKGCKHPERKCAGGRDITYLGKEFKGAAWCAPLEWIRFTDPGEKEIGMIKKLIELEKQART